MKNLRKINNIISKPGYSGEDVKEMQIYHCFSTEHEFLSLLAKKIYF